MQFFKKNIPLTFLFLEDLRPSATSILKSYCLDFGVANPGGVGSSQPILEGPIFFLPASIVCAIQFLREMLNAFSRIFPKSSAEYGLKRLSHFF